MAAQRDDLHGATQAVVGLHDDVFAAPGHQTEPVVLPLSHGTASLHPATPVALSEVA